MGFSTFQNDIPFFPVSLYLLMKRKSTHFCC